MDKINERMYQANIELVDRNKLLEKDVSILQKRIDKAIEILNSRDNYTDSDFESMEFQRDIISVLKGEENGDNW